MAEAEGGCFVGAMGAVAWRWGVAGGGGGWRVGDEFLKAAGCVGKAGQESCSRPSDNRDIPTLGSAQGPSLEAPVALALQALIPRGGQGSRLDCGRMDTEPHFICLRHTPAGSGGYRALRGDSQEAEGVSCLGGGQGWLEFGSQGNGELPVALLGVEIGSGNPSRAGSL